MVAEDLVIADLFDDFQTLEHQTNRARLVLAANLRFDLQAALPAISAFPSGKRECGVALSEIAFDMRVFGSSNGVDSPQGLLRIRLPYLSKQQCTRCPRELVSERLT